MDLRKAAEELVDFWKHGNRPVTPELVLALDQALSQPDMLAEAVQLLRQAEIMLACYEYHPLPRQIAAFTTRYDAAQQEQNDA